jgi:hypothetical protein
MALIWMLRREVVVDMTATIGEADFTSNDPIPIRDFQSCSP